MNTDDKKDDLNPFTLGSVNEDINFTNNTSIETLDTNINNEKLENFGNSDHVNQNNIEMPAPVVIPSQESIGGIPPEKEEKPKMNKILFIILIMVLILGIAFGVYYFLSLSKNNGNIELKNLIYNVNSDLPKDINNYATFNGISSNNCSLDISKVDVTKVGSYDYYVKCSENTYVGKVQIKDDLELKVETKDLILVKGSKLNAEDFITSCNKKKCTYSFINEEEVMKLMESAGGPHVIGIKVSDGNKEIEKEVKLTVIIAYLEATKTISDTKIENATVSVSDKFAIGLGNTYIGGATRIYNYVFSDKGTYDKYNKDLKEATEFDGIAGIVNASDETNTISVKVNLTDDVLNIEYENEFPKDYTSIKEYYLSKGYEYKIVKE